MAIVNGQYVQEPVGSMRSLQNQYFGDYTKRDMADYSEAALQIRLKEIENQNNLDFWKYQQEYDTPTAQMQRFQDAGLNPNLIYGQQNVAGEIKSAQAPSPSSSGTFAKNAQVAMQGVSQMIQAVKAGVDLYDYMHYGAAGSDLQNRMLSQQIFNEHVKGSILGYQNTTEAARAAWEQFINWDPALGYYDPDERGSHPQDLSRSLHGQVYLSQRDATLARIDQINALVSMIPDQIARQKAMVALEKYRLDIMHGENDAVLDINTGNETWDTIIKGYIYTLKNSLGAVLGFAGRAAF